MNYKILHRKLKTEHNKLNNWSSVSCMPHLLYVTDNLPQLKMIINLYELIVGCPLQGRMLWRSTHYILLVLWLSNIPPVGPAAFVLPT